MQKSRVTVHNPGFSVRNTNLSCEGKTSHMTHSPGAPLRVAVVGAGMIGHVHAEVVSSLKGIATLAAVVDSDAPTAARVAARHGAEALTSLAEVGARPDIDVVSICLPSGTHAS